MVNKALYKIGYGLYILTAKSPDGELDNGCIINTAVQVTDSPKAISITVNKSNLTHDMIMETKEFNLSVISDEAPFALFERFGFKSGRYTNKFDDNIEAGRSENGICYVSRYVNAYLCCVVKATVDLGTHTMFIADVTDSEVLSEVPSMTYAFYHANVKPKPEEKNVSGYRCTICNYVYEGDTLPDDFICPICKHGVSDFEKI